MESSTPLFRKRLVDYIRARDEYERARIDINRVSPGLVRDIRESLVLTQSEFAEKMGVGDTYISRMEHGHATPSQEMFTKLFNLVKDK